MIVPANLDEFGEEWSLPADDLRLWVCLHEVAHPHRARRPPRRGRLATCCTSYVAGFEPTRRPRGPAAELDMRDPSSMPGIQSLFGDPEVLLGAIQSPAQRELLPRSRRCVAAIVGYVDHVMDDVGGRARCRATRCSPRRCAAAGSRPTRPTASSSGSSASSSPRRLRPRRARSCAGVVERAGEEGLARLWDVRAHPADPGRGRRPRPVAGPHRAARD